MKLVVNLITANKIYYNKYKRMNHLNNRWKKNKYSDS